jgi:hypothetical protein
VAGLVAGAPCPAWRLSAPLDSGGGVELFYSSLKESIRSKRGHPLSSNSPAGQLVGTTNETL